MTFLLRSDLGQNGSEMTELFCRGPDLGQNGSEMTDIFVEARSRAEWVGND